MCGERLTTDLVFVSTAGRPGHVMRYCRERKAVFDNSSKPSTELRRRWHLGRRNTPTKLFSPFTPSPTRGRSPIRRCQIPVAISPIQSVARP
ncbi:hypothetical protein TNCV_2962931 [Trichonephila clavipes]|nr:hypothetical protein TNCV_2962931 [Trichonephila clavipes]